MPIFSFKILIYVHHPTRNNVRNPVICLSFNQLQKILSLFFSFIMTIKKNIAILLFDKIEVLDFAGPFEVFSVCGASGPNPGHFNVYTVAEKSPVLARNGLSINPQFSLDNCPIPYIMVIPGGGGFYEDGSPYGSRKEMHNPVILNWIEKHNATAELVLSVCTGSLMLAKAGLLNGLSATTHWKAMDQLKEVAPDTKLVYDGRWVDNGRIITSAGVSAGIDMSLYVISKLMGRSVADETARYMQYDHWGEGGNKE